MADILIRGMPDDVVERLKSSAQSHGRSIEAEALELVCRGVKLTFTADERIERSRHYLSRSGGPYEPLTKEQLSNGSLRRRCVCGAEMVRRRDRLK